jgi:hypothetical protein
MTIADWRKHLESDPFADFKGSDGGTAIGLHIHVSRDCYSFSERVSNALLAWALGFDTSLCRQLFGRIPEGGYREPLKIDQCMKMHREVSGGCGRMLSAHEQGTYEWRIGNSAPCAKRMVGRIETVAVAKTFVISTELRETLCEISLLAGDGSLRDYQWSDFGFRNEEEAARKVLAEFTSHLSAKSEEYPNAWWNYSTPKGYTSADTTNFN